MDNIAVVGMVLVPDDPLVIATIAITGSESTKAKAGTGIYPDQLSISVSAITYPSAGATIPDPGPYSENMNSSSQKVKLKALDKLVLLEGDESGTINATPKIPSTPNPIDFPISFKIQIQSAGQIKAKAN